MNHFNGILIDLRQHAGCVEVIVSGPHPGAFTIDNCLLWGIVDVEGRNWIGRAVEYADGTMRFLDASNQPRKQPPTYPGGSTSGPLTATVE